MKLVIRCYIASIVFLISTSTSFAVTIGNEQVYFRTAKALSSDPSLPKSLIEVVSLKDQRVILKSREVSSDNDQLVWLLTRAAVADASVMNGGKIELVAGFDPAELKAEKFEFSKGPTKNRYGLINTIEKLGEMTGKYKECEFYAIKQNMDPEIKKGSGVSR